MRTAKNQRWNVFITDFHPANRTALLIRMLGTYLAMLQRQVGGFKKHVFLLTGKRLKKVMPLAVFIGSTIH
jgi:hypothetical protein